jgi:hypothetical protein
LLLMRSSLPDSSPGRLPTSPYHGDLTPCACFLQASASPAFESLEPRVWDVQLRLVSNAPACPGSLAFSKVDPSDVAHLLFQTRKRVLGSLAPGEHGSAKLNLRFQTRKRVLGSLAESYLNFLLDLNCRFKRASASSAL